MPAGLANGLKVLSLLASHELPLNAREIAERTSIPRTTTYRLLSELAEDGWVVETGVPKGYVATSRTAEVGISWLRHNRVRELVLPHAIDLARQTGRVCNLAFYDRGEAFYTDLVEVVGERVMPVLHGVRTPAASTAGGKVLLAFQDELEIERVATLGLPAMGPRTKTTPDEIRRDVDEARERGFAVTDGEFNETFAAVAVPVFASFGAVAAALSVTARTPLPSDFVAKALDAAFPIAAQSSAELGYRAASRHILA